MNKLRWVEGPMFSDYKQDNLVRVVYASLNFRDIMVATGRIPYVSQNRSAFCAPLGCEFVGFNTAGQRIMGISTHRYKKHKFIVSQVYTECFKSSASGYSKKLLNNCETIKNLLFTILTINVENGRRLQLYKVDNN